MMGFEIHTTLKKYEIAEIVNYHLSIIIPILTTQANLKLLTILRQVVLPKLTFHSVFVKVGCS